MKLKQYGIWMEEQYDDKGELVDGGYWSIYDSIADAISSEGNGTEVYCLRAKYSGRYKMTTKTVKLRKRKSKVA